MIPYIIVLVITIILVSISEKKLKNGKKAFGIGCLVLLIATLSLFAGLRTVDLGYDTSKYVMTLYRFLNSGKNLQLLLSNYTSVDKGFITYMYLLYRLNNNINFILVFLNLPVNLFFVIFMYHFRQKASMKLMAIVYYCTLYAFSFNIIRQSIALSLLLLIIVLIDKRKYLLSVIPFIIGITFHSSMVLAVLTFAIMFLNDNKKIKKSNKTGLLATIVIFIVLTLLFYDKAITFASEIGLISSKFLNYLNENSRDYRQNIDIEYSLLFLKSSIIVMTILYRNMKSINNKIKDENAKWETMLFIDFFVTFLSFKLRNTDRISWYMYYPAVFLLAPQLGITIKKYNNKLNIGNMIIAIIFLLYLLEKLITNQYGICPYTWVL